MFVVDISEEFIADPQIGDNLVAIGFNGTSYNNHRLWSGIVMYVGCVRSCYGENVLSISRR
jgi:hypothetical protein